MDMTTGTFKVKVTGRSYKDAKRTRSIIATFRRDSFLNFVYFTNYENRDPAAEPDASERTYQQNNCADKYRTARKDLDCSEIQFATGDKINGPLHTNDENLLICGSPAFGRTTNRTGTTPRTKTDTVEVRGGGTGHLANPGPSNRRARTPRHQHAEPTPSRPRPRCSRCPRATRRSKPWPSTATATTRARPGSACAAP